MRPFASIRERDGIVHVELRERGEEGERVIALFSCEVGRAGSAASVLFDLAQTSALDEPVAAVLFPDPQDPVALAAAWEAETMTTTEQRALTGATRSLTLVK